MTTGQILSAFIPVIPLQGYLVAAEFKGTPTEEGGIQVLWYKADRITPSATATSTWYGTASGGRDFLKFIITAPSDAYFARLRPYRYSGTSDMFFYNTDLQEMLPCFRAVLTGNQAIAAQGATVITFDNDTFLSMSTSQFDSTAGFNTSTNMFEPRQGVYEFDAMVLVSSTDGSQVPSYADIYNANSSTVLAVGPVVGATTPALVAHFPVHCGPVYCGGANDLKVRFHAFGACTVLAAGSWFAGRQVI